MPNTNLFLQFFFRVCQVLAWTSTRLYFRKVVVLNPQFLNTEGPLIIICNHPNTLLDPLMAVQQTQERPFLLANYSLFKNPVSRIILSTLYCIPVQRSKDIPVGQTPKNDEAFRRSVEHLYAGGSIFLAPESLSENGRQLRPFKSGVSRIVLSALDDWKNDNKPLRILPVGLTYFDPKKPNSDVVVNVGAPIDIKKETENLHEHYKKAVDELTNIIENKMRPLVIDCANKEEDIFLKKVETILQNDNPVSLEIKFFRSQNFLKFFFEKNFEKNISENVSENVSEKNIPESKNKKNFEKNIFQNEIENYFSKLEAMNLRDVNLKTFPMGKNILILVFGLPVFIFGFINNIIPVTLATFIKNKMNLEDYETTIQYVAGLVLFPVFWCLQAVIFSWFFYNPNFILAYWFYAITTGLFARYYYVCFLKTCNYFSYKKLEVANHLSLLRQPITENLKRW